MIAVNEMQLRFGPSPGQQNRRPSNRKSGAGARTKIPHATSLGGDVQGHAWIFWSETALPPRTRPPQGRCMLRSVIVERLIEADVVSERIDHADFARIPG